MDDNGDEATVPLVVDMDSALVRGDLFLEAFATRLRRGPFSFLRYIVREAFGRRLSAATVRREVYSHAQPDVRLLPYATELCQFLKEQQEAGRRIVLLTRSRKDLASAIAEHLGLHGGIVVCEGALGQSSGKDKLASIRAAIGDSLFDYAGSSPGDMVVWNAARRGILAGRTEFEKQRLQRRVTLDRVFDPVALRLRVLLKAVRAYQFSKNLLLFVPIIAAHEIDDLTKWHRLLLAFFAFSLTAAAVYVVNDTIDLEADREHPSKRKRPIASGELPLRTALVLVPALGVVGLFCALLLGRAFFTIMLLYLVLTTTYTFLVKRIVIADSILLACLYTLRIVAGGIATDIMVSHWLLAFANFFFLSLAFAKRYAELCRLEESRKGPVRGRGYLTHDLEQVAQFGSTSGYISVLVLALYVNSDTVASLYREPEWLWLVCPLMQYWISRIWILATRGELEEDAIVFAVSDRVSYFIGALCGFILYFAS